MDIASFDTGLLGEFGGPTLLEYVTGVAVVWSPAITPFCVIFEDSVVIR